MMTDEEFLEKFETLAKPLIDFHHREARRLGLSDAALWELVFVTEQFNAVNKIGDCLHLEPDMYEGLRPPAQAGAPSGGTP